MGEDTVGSRQVFWAGPRLLLAVFLAWSALEIGAYLRPAELGPTLKWGFLGTTLAAVLLTPFVFLRGLWAELRSGQWLGLAACGVVAVVALQGLGSVHTREISTEATQQVCWGMNFLSSPAGGMHQTGFLDYPARQYLVIGLPAYLGGRSLVHLRLGYAACFLLGVLAFHAGLRAWLSDLGDRAASLGAALGVLLPLGFTHLTLWLWISEQSILPVSLTLFVVGWLLLWHARAVRPELALLPLIWVGALLPMCYPPALATVGLVFAFALGQAWLARRTDPALAQAALGYAALLVVVTALSLHLQATARFQIIGDAGKPDWAELVQRFLNAAKLIFLDQPSGCLNAFAFLIVGLTMALALAGILGWCGRFVALWILATLFAAMSMVGYTPRPPAFDLHRHMGTIPLIAAMAAFWIAWSRRHLSEQLSAGRWRLLDALILVYAALGALSNHWFGLRDIIPKGPQPRPSDVLYADLARIVRERKLGPTASFQVHAPIHLLTKHSQDFSCYFCPNAVFIPSDKAPLSPANVSPGPVLFRVSYRELATHESAPPDGHLLTFFVQGKSWRLLQTFEPVIAQPEPPKPAEPASNDT